MWCLYFQYSQPLLKVICGKRSRIKLMESFRKTINRFVDKAVDILVYNILKYLTVPIL
jgi:hypothetical protein